MLAVKFAFETKTANFKTNFKRICPFKTLPLNVACMFKMPAFSNAMVRNLRKDCSKSEYLHVQGVIFQGKVSIFQSNRGKPVVLAYLHQQTINI